MEDYQHKITYLKIREIADRKFVLDLVDSAKQFERTSSWLIAGASYAEFSCLMALHDLRGFYSSKTLKFFICFLALSIMFGVLNIIVINWIKIKKDSLQSVLSSNGQHIASFTAYSEMLRGFSGKSGVARKEHYVKQAVGDFFKGIGFFLLQVLFFLLAFFYIIIASCELLIGK